MNQKLVPLQTYGIDLTSIGALTSSEQDMVWRGPMASRPIQQLLSDVSWGELDYLIIDLPPGTGEPSLTTAQAAPLTGVAKVSNAQVIAGDGHQLAPLVRSTSRQSA